MSILDMDGMLEEVEPNDPMYKPNSLAQFIEECRRVEDDPTVFVDFGGRRYRPPFRCLCCGKQVSLAQFCYGRLCGPCDCGACQYGNRSFDPRACHPRLSRDYYLTISEPAPAEVNAGESIN